MRNLLCVMGRHDWQAKQDKEGRPYEICGRPGCYRLRNHDSRSDGPYTHTDTQVSHCRPMYHLTGVPEVPRVPPVAAGDLGGCRRFRVRRRRCAAVFFRTLDRG